MQEEKISQSDFVDWKNQPITKIIFENLNTIREEINLTLTNSDVLLGKDSHVQIPRLIGYREGVDLLLQISYEDLENQTGEGQ